MQLIAAQFNETIERLDARLAQLEDKHDELLKAIAEQKPTVKIPPRPSAFRVEIDGGEKIMEIEAIRPN